MAKSKSKHKGKGGGKPQGATYADMLARKAAIQKGIEKCATDTAMQIQIDIGVQRAMWLMVCSIADAFGIGPERMMRDYFPALQANREEYERMKAEVDEEYANEKMRQRAEQVSGQNIEYLYEHEMREAGFKLGESDGFVPITRADRIREKFQSMNDEALARFIFERADGEIGYCRKLPECDEDLDKGDIPEERCLACLMQWLKEPEGGADHA